MSAGRPVKVAFLADTKDLEAGITRSESAMDGAAKSARASGERIDAAFDSTAEHADNVASKGAQAAGALTGLGELIGGPFGAAMQTSGIAMQAAADGGDLLNVVTDSAIVRKIKDTAVTAAQTTATVAQTAAQKAAAIGTKVWTGAQWLLNTALTANPIGIVVVAIAALVAAVIIAYKKSDTFRAIVTTAFDKVKQSAQWLWDKIKALAGGFATSLGRIKSAATSVNTWVVERFRDLRDKLNDIKNRFSFSGMFDGIKTAFKAAVNFIIGKWNGLSFTIGGGSILGKKLPKVTLTTPNIPYLASGGITTGPTLAVVGDNPGGREAIIPLDKYPLGNTYNVTVIVDSALSPAEEGRRFKRAIEEAERLGAA